MARQPCLGNVEIPRRHRCRLFKTQGANLLVLGPAFQRQVSRRKRNIQTALRNIARQRPSSRRENDTAPARLRTAAAMLDNTEHAEHIKTSQVRDVDVINNPRAIASRDAVPLTQDASHHDGNYQAGLLDRPSAGAEDARRLDADGVHAQLLAQLLAQAQRDQYHSCSFYAASNAETAAESASSNSTSSRASPVMGLSEMLGLPDVWIIQTAGCCCCCCCCCWPEVSDVAAALSFLRAANPRISASAYAGWKPVPAVMTTSCSAASAVSVATSSRDVVATGFTRGL
ncbi:hypothetical protein IWX49DRAFT_555085 [Phyllosticta citricarpa]|uniref:Uncharacterized protein n=1 Tax=Phyllosticta citricarpa TaxID=55181 RepID=A0ABR1M257_9PEZI